MRQSKVEQGHLLDCELQELFGLSLTTVNSYLFQRRYNKGDFVFLPDNKADSLFFVVRGKVKIGSYADGQKEVIKSICSVGDIFGELAYLDSSRRINFAQSLSDHTILYEMDVKWIDFLSREEQNLTGVIFTKLSDRIAELEQKVTSLVAKDAKSRIIDYLVNQAEKEGVKVGYEVMVKNYLTHYEIASITGTSRQTVTSLLNQLKEQNFINFNRKQFLIRDLDNLRQQATIH